MINLLERVESHLAQSGTAATEFGRQVMRDPNFVRELREGRDFRKSTAERIIEYINMQEATQ